MKTGDLERLRASAAEASNFLQAISNEKRLLVLCHLMGGERSVGSLADLVGLSQSALSQHLSKLRAQKLVKTRRDAQTIYYSSNSEQVLTLLDALESIYGKGIADENKTAA